MSANDLPLWLTEDITWVLLWGILAIGIAGFVWFVSRKTLPLVIAILLTSLVIGAVVVDVQIESDREYLERAVFEMADSVRNNDAEGGRGIYQR